MRQKESNTTKKAAKPKPISRVAAMREKKRALEADTWIVINELFDNPPEVKVATFQSAQHFVNQLGVEKTLDAVEIAVSRIYTTRSDDLFRYFCGVCWNFVREKAEQ